MTVELPYKYTPREKQIPAWRAMDEKKRVMLVWHRRCGKDKLCFNKLIVKAVEQMANYAYYFPTAALGRRALWDNVDVNNGMRVIDHIPQELLLTPPNQTEMKIRLVNGSTIQILGTDNLDVVGGNYFGTVWSEMSLQNPMAWDLTRPILAENGGWAWFNGTPRGRNHFLRMLNSAQSDKEDWFAEVLTVKDTGYISEKDIEAERRSGMKEPMIEQEFYCSFSAANPGAIYAKEIEKARQQKRVSNDILWFKELPVYTSWDVGAPMNQKVWVWQLVGDRINYLESLSGSDECKTPADWAARLKDKQYGYGGHFIPHDAAAAVGGLWQEALGRSGLTGVVPVPRQFSAWDGINLGIDAFFRCYFNADGCQDGIDALDAYHSKEERDGVTIRDVPVHDWASHFCDAFSLSHQAIKRGMVIDRSAIPRRAERHEATKVVAGFRGGGFGKVRR
jgi:phage terminase large subunit